MLIDCMYGTDGRMDGCFHFVKLVM